MKEKVLPMSMLKVLPTSLLAAVRGNVPLNLVAIVFLLAAFSLLFGAQGAEAARKPNIIFILADDLGYGDIGPFGQKIIHTPTLDKLASEGMKFTQHYAGCPVCAPSRCVFITGKHPGHGFVRDNREVGSWYSFQGQIPLPASEPSIAATLKSAGYATAAFGKWGLGGVGSSGDPLNHGFDHFFGFNDQRQAHNYFPHYLNEDESKFILTGNSNVSEQENLSLPAGADANDPASYSAFTGTQYAPDLCCDRALQFIRQNKEKPFFLYYPTTVPHLALQVPADSLDEYRGKLDDHPYPGGKGYLPHQYPHAAYAAMITRLDRDIGRLLSLTKALGLYDDTVFIFTSDNGGVFPLAGVDPAYFRSNGDLRGYKQDIYEGGIREPLIVSWKGHIAAGTTSTRVTGFEDWLPTLLELAGDSKKAPTGLDGISFAPTLLGKKQAERPFLYREYHGSGGQQSVRAGDWKLVRLHLVGTAKNPAAPTTELYNLANDPSEKQNVASQHPDVVARLMKLAAEQHRASKEFPVPALDGTAAK
jgi:arylsulfatase A-like enzyme